MGDMTFTMTDEGVASLETEHGPRTANEYFDLMLAGAFCELYHGAEGITLQQILSGTNWFSLLSTETARLDLEIVGPMLTHELVLQSASRVQRILDKFFSGSNPEALETLTGAIERMEPGQSFKIKRKSKIIH
jgi:hypothetical protein